MSACSVRVNGQDNNSYEGEYTHADVDVNEFHNTQFYLLAFLIIIVPRMTKNIKVTSPETILACLLLAYPFACVLFNLGLLLNNNLCKYTINLLIASKKPKKIMAII